MDQDKIAEEFVKAVAWDGSTQVIRPDELGRYTDRGWTLLATYEVDIPSWDYRMNDRGCEIVGEPETQQHCGYDGPAHLADRPVPMKRSEPFAIRQRFFVIGETRDAKMEELRERCSSARRSESQLGQKLHQSQKREKKAREDLKLLEDVVGDLRKENRSHDAYAETSATARQKMEEHLAKLRNALGTKAWKEILG